jgi:hypothetical protein
LEVKKFAILGSILAVVVLLAMTVTPALAAPPTTVTVTWEEDATRYYPDGTVWATWTDDPNGPMDLLRTGKAYHAVDIAEFYNIELPDIEGGLVISGAGKLSGHATYTSLVSELPIKEHLKGEVTIEAGTMVGTYTQYAWAFGSQEDVLSHYPWAVPEKSPEAGGWWLIGYTVYTVHQ